MKTMKLIKGLLLSAVIGSTWAASDPAAIYLFQGNEWPSTAKPPFITPEDARLILAQRLSVAGYHAIGDANSITHINTFGPPHDSKLRELVLMVEGVTLQTAMPLANPFTSLWSAFKILNPPSSAWTQKLVKDFETQIGSPEKNCDFMDNINPMIAECWSGNSKIIRVDLTEKSPSIQELKKAKDMLIEYAKDSKMNVAVVFMPESARTANTYSNPYGSYDMPSQGYIQRREQAEEPMTEPAAEPFSTPVSHFVTVSTGPIIGVPPVCYKSLDDCISKTNSCSGRGKCYKKSGTKKADSKSDSACYTCMCQPQTKTVEVGTDKMANITTYWGGSACQKEDISSSFWLLLIVSLVLVGIVGWGISMLFSIGEEKLPGVIGAGVSSKTR